MHKILFMYSYMYICKYRCYIDKFALLNIFIFVMSWPYKLFQTQSPFYTKFLWRWEPDRMSNFFSPPVHLSCAVTYII